MVLAIFLDSAYINVLQVLIQKRVESYVGEL